MNNIIKPLREENDNLRKDIKKKELKKAEQGLSLEEEISLSCDKYMLKRYENVESAMLAEYEKIKKAEINE